jgi:hypothetical protein
MLISIQTHTTQNNKLGTYISLTFMDVGYSKNRIKQTNNTYLENNVFLTWLVINLNNDASY